MKISRIEIKNFRVLSKPLVIAKLDRGLTLISGQNEEGKSTVLAALRAAFFERHRLSASVASHLKS